MTFSYASFPEKAKTEKKGASELFALGEFKITHGLNDTSRWASI